MTRIDGWKSLNYDWDGDGAEAPSRIALQSLRGFIREVQSAELPAPDAYLSADGEVGLRWLVADRRFATVAFLGDGHVIAYCIGGLLYQEPFGTDRQYEHSEASPDIISAIKAVV